MSLETVSGNIASVGTIAAGSRGTDMMPVPVEQLPTAMAIRVLQIQIFHLTDAMRELVKVIEAMNGKSKR